MDTKLDELLNKFEILVKTMANLGSSVEEVRKKQEIMDKSLEEKLTNLPKTSMEDSNEEKKEEESVEVTPQENTSKLLESKSKDKVEVASIQPKPILKRMIRHVNSPTPIKRKPVDIPIAVNKPTTASNPVPFTLDANDEDHEETQPPRNRLLTFSDMANTPLSTWADSYDVIFTKEDGPVPDNMPRFRGNRGIHDPTQFIEKFVRKCKALGVNVIRYPALLVECLEDIDAKWMENYFDAFWNELTWNNIVDHFVEHFQDANKEARLHRELESLKMDAKEGLQRYSDEFMNLASKLSLNLAAYDTKEKFKRGLIYHYKKDLGIALASRANLTDGPVDVPTLIEMLKIIESEYLSSQLDRNDKQKSKWCDFCRKSSHNTENCFSKKAKEKRNAENKNNETTNNSTATTTTSNSKKEWIKGCFECKAEDHIRRDCPLLKNKSPKIDNIVVDDDYVEDRVLYTLCYVNGRLIQAKVDSGANKSVIDRRLVKEMGLTIIPRRGRLRQAFKQSTMRRLGVVKDVRLENGDKVLSVELEVAYLDDEKLLIGLDLFKDLDYAIMNIPFTLPAVPQEVPKKDNNDTDLPPNVDPITRHAVEWKESIEYNKNIPPNSICTLEGSELSLPTSGEPVFNAQGRPHPVFDDSMDKQVVVWWKNGNIELASGNSKWNHRLVAVVKKGKNGAPDSVRVCIDCKSLNEQLPDPPEHSLPMIRDIINDMADFEWASLIDISNSFHQFLIKEEDRDKLSFTWRGVRYRFRTVPFGVKTMPHHMQKNMEKLIKQYRKSPYIDDTPIATRKGESHTDEVKAVIDKFNEVNLRINWNKSEFFKKYILVLGHLLFPGSVKMDPAKIKAIVNWERPKNGKAMQRFLGAVNYHRDFSPKFAEILAPLDSLRNVSGPIEWTEDLVKAFENVKDLFHKDMELRSIDWKKKFYLTTDASATGVGAWLGQRDDRGKLMPVLCISKKLSPAQRRWCATKRELWALMWAMSKFRHYLTGRKFTARVDHRPLVHLVKDPMNPMLEGWVDTILSYDFDTEYVPGNFNSFADALSRSQEEDISIGAISVSDDLESKLILAAESRGKVVPSELERSKLVARSHALGHLGVESMFKSLSDKGYWWPKMRKDLQNIVAGCNPCQRYDIKRAGYHPMQSVEANKPWDHIQIDLIEMPESRAGFLFTLTCVDVLTGYVVVRGLRSKTMEEVARVLWSIFSEYGVPKIVQSDNGTEFVNEVLKALMSLYGIEQRLITAYHPRANGLVERMNKEVSRALKKYMLGAFEEWEEWLPLIQVGLNCRHSKRIGCSPFELLHGRKFNEFVDFSTAEVCGDFLDAIEDRKAEVEKLHKVVFPAVAERVHHQRKLRNSKADAKVKIVESLAPGTKVMVIDSENGSKWLSKYVGPFTIVRRTKGGAYVVKDSLGRDLGRNVNIEMLKVMQDDTSVDSALSEGEGKVTENLAIVEDILDHRKSKSHNGYDYLVHWENTTEEEDEWVSEKDFNGTDMIMEYWKAILPKRARPIKGVSADDEWKPEEKSKLEETAAKRKSTRIANPQYKHKYVPTST